MYDFDNGEQNEKQLVHYDTCDLSDPLLHSVKWATRVISIVYYYIARLPKSTVTPIRALSSSFLHREISTRAK